MTGPVARAEILEAALRQIAAADKAAGTASKAWLAGRLAHVAAQARQALDRAGGA